MSSDCIQCEGVGDDPAKAVFSDPVDRHMQPTTRSYMVCCVWQGSPTWYVLKNVFPLTI